MGGMGSGGEREGAGRKPGDEPPKEVLTVRLSVDVIAWLAMFGRDKALIVESAIRARMPGQE